MSNKEFKWTDELVAEYSLASQSLTLFDFKRKKIAELQSKPEWEIIKVASPECGLYYLEGYKMRPNDKIYSIKRLSDNSIWEIDDKFIANAGCELTIKRFDITDIGVQVWSKEFGFWFLEEIKKPRLFTTEDGVDIFNPHLKVCSVGKSTFEISESRADLIQEGHHNHYLYFSCRVNAEEYILMNKPLFSVKEIMDISDARGTVYDLYVKKYIDKAKEKLEVINKP